MLIKEVKTYPLFIETPEPFYYGEGWIKNRGSLIVEIITEDGISGWGEGFCHGNQPPELAQAVVEYVFRPLLLGKNVEDMDVIWEQMYYVTQPYGRSGIAVSAISAVDVALWDCLGRSLAQPIYKLLGGAYRKDVPAYASGFFRSPCKKYPDADVEEAEKYVSLGYKGMKVKSGFGVTEDVNTIRRIREAIGGDIMLMVDANCTYNVAAARKLLKMYEDLNVYWFEEPLPPSDFEGYLELKNLTSVYIAGCENEFTKYGFRKWISQRAIDILQPDLCFAGGFTECKKILALAQAWNITVMPHAWGSGIGQAASMQLLAVVPPAPSAFVASEPMLEYDNSAHPFRNELVWPNLQLNSEGRVPISDKPGIGVEINRDAIEKYIRK